MARQSSRNAQVRWPFGSAGVHAATGAPGQVAKKHTLAAPDAVVARLRELMGAAAVDATAVDAAAVDATSVDAPVQRQKKRKDAGHQEEVPAQRQKVRKQKAPAEDKPVEDKPSAKKRKGAEKDSTKKKAAAAMDVASGAVRGDNGVKAARLEQWGGGDDAEDDFGIDLLAVQVASKEGKQRKQRRR